MKTLKHATISLLILSISLLINLNSIAQSADDKTEKRVQKLKTELSLSDDQTVQIRQILTDAKSNAGKMKEDNKDKSRREKTIAAKSELKDVNEKIEKILTAEQKTKYQELKKEMKAEMRKKIKEYRKNKND